MNNDYIFLKKTKHGVSRINLSIANGMFVIDNLISLFTNQLQAKIVRKRDMVFYGCYWIKIKESYIYIKFDEYDGVMLRSFFSEGHRLLRDISVLIDEKLPSL